MPRHLSLLPRKRAITARQHLEIPPWIRLRSPQAFGRNDKGDKGSLPDATARKGAVALQLLDKSANFDRQIPYLSLEQGITRGCFPLRSGTGSCAAPLFSPSGIKKARPARPPLQRTKSGISIECCVFR